MMSLDYAIVSKEAKFKDVFKTIKKHELRTGKMPTILVAEEGILIGEIPQRVLVLRKQSENVKKHIKKIPTIHYDRDEKEVIRSFKTHPHKKIVVLDDDNSIMGVIFSDDILRLLEQPTGDLYDFAGVLDEEDVHDSALTKVRHRYKWVVLNLMTGLLVASVVAMFQDTIEALVLLAVYMPIVAGMGGTAGTQALAVVVRGLTLKEIELKTGKRVIINEVLAGAMNGIIVGGLVATFAVFFHQSPFLGLALSIALIVNLMVAGLFGATVPLIMKALNKDPATSATIFITTATDVCGFLVFLGLATLIL